MGAVLIAVDLRDGFRSLYDLIRSQEDRRRDAERLRDPKVGHELALGRLLYRQGGSTWAPGGPTRFSETRNELIRGVWLFCHSRGCRGDEPTVVPIVNKSNPLSCCRKPQPRIGERFELDPTLPVIDWVEIHILIPGVTSEF